MAKILPTHEECAEKMKANKATALEIFIHDYEPAGIEDEKEFKNKLVAMLNEQLQNVAKIAWDESRFAFSKEVGDDVNEIESYGPISKSAKELVQKLIYKTV